MPLFFTCPILLFPPLEDAVDLFRQSQYKCKTKLISKVIDSPNEKYPFFVRARHDLYNVHIFIEFTNILNQDLGSPQESKEVKIPDTPSSVIHISHKGLNAEQCVLFSKGLSFISTKQAHLFNSTNEPNSS